jgi:hypothetical protein
MPKLYIAKGNNWKKGNKDSTLMTRQTYNID